MPASSKVVDTRWMRSNKNDFYSPTSKRRAIKSFFVTGEKNIYIRIAHRVAHRV